MRLIRFLIPENHSVCKVHAVFLSLEAKEAVEVIEATDVVEAVEVSEAAEVLRPEKLLLMTSELTRFLNSLYF